MKNIQVTRKKKLANAIVPYWIMTHKNKTEFMSEYELKGDACKMSMLGGPVSRLDMQVLDRFGIRIMNGQSIELELPDEITTLFVSTMHGYLSNEINIDKYIASGDSVVINTNGGFINLPHPVIE